MNTDLIKCQCNNDCQCSVEVSKAVVREGKAFCCEPCADGLSCGCRWWSDPQTSMPRFHEWGFLIVIRWVKADLVSHILPSV